MVAQHRVGADLPQHEIRLRKCFAQYAETVCGLASLNPITGKRLDNHVFACSKCNEVQTYVFDRT